jgi:hypothetical protein
LLCKVALRSSLVRWIEGGTKDCLGLMIVDGRMLNS